ncbi:MAG: ATP-binding protein [Chitinispirillales bacterium]|jgi:predicted AAA+ superfamily ATPase|nr:ATP-binding protein [Chitinispirillales bacterium]
MIIRELSGEINSVMSYYSVLVITGPRQSGKTTLCKDHFEGYNYFNLEDSQIREQIALEPKPFLEKYAEKGIILDEVQKYPELFSIIQVIVDERPEYKFVLTGSSNFSLMHNITQSLAGRAALFTLLPLSISELKDFDLSDTDELLFGGGFATVWAKQTPPYLFCKNYYNTYIERDVRQLINVKNITKFQTFVRLCAGRIGSEFNASSLSNEIGVSVNTIAEWLSVLEASYVLFRLPPFYKNIGKRLVKAPKIYFYDTALVCYLMGIENKSQLQLHFIRPALFENMAVVEFVKNRFNSGKDSNLYFYRDKSQHEVDIIEDFGTYFQAWEVKSAKTFHSDFTKNLKYLKNILGGSLTKTRVIYDGQTLELQEYGMNNLRDIFKDE